MTRNHMARAYLTAVILVLNFLTQYLSKFKTNLNLNGGYPKKCKEKNEIDLEALYIPGQAKKQKICPTLTFSYFGLYFIISWS